MLRTLFIAHHQIRLNFFLFAIFLTWDDVEKINFYNIIQEVCTVVRFSRETLFKESCNCDQQETVFFFREKIKII
jgi:hypothetical protein